MKICFISHSGYTGGAEKALLELIDALKIYHVDMFVLLPFSGPLCQELTKREIPFRVVKYRPWTGDVNATTWKKIINAIFNVIMLIPVITCIINWKCDIVYTNTITICIGAIAAVLTKKPHIWHIHEFGEEDHGLRFFFGKKFSLGLMNHLSSTCIANSIAVAEKYRKYINHSKLQMIYQSVTYLNAHTNLNLQGDNMFKCIMVGKISVGKNQEDAIRAIAEVRKEGISAELYLVGDGLPSYMNLLEQLISKMKLEKYVHFVGYVDNPFPYIEAADVMLVCSVSEAFGRVTIEGMLAKKPVIGARCGATAELIIDGFNGLLYQKGQYKELAEKIVYLHSHSEVRFNMEKNGKEWATENFSQERYGRDMLKVLQKSLKKGALGGITP